MSRLQRSGRLPLALIAGLVALAVSVWFLLTSAAGLTDHRYQQTAATEYALTLTRVASAVAAPDIQNRADLFRSDEIARLVAMGDIQSAQLASFNFSGWFRQTDRAELNSGAELLSNQWSSIRSALVALNTRSSRLDSSDAGLDNRVPDLAIEEYRLSFRRVFEAITKDTLSVQLLRKVSEISANLDSMGFLVNHPRNAEFIDSIAQTIELLKTNVNELRALSRREDGASLLGYETNLLLQKFSEETARLPDLLPRRAVTAAPVAAQGPAFQGADLQPQILTALNQSEAYRRALDSVIHHYRRSVLAALAGVCAVLFLVAMLALRVWRSKNTIATAAPEMFESIIDDINDIADGHLHKQVRIVEDDNTLLAVQGRKIARAMNYTGDMLRNLVVLTRGVASQTSRVALQQRSIAEEQIQVDLQRRHRIAALVEELKQRSASLKVIASQESNSTKNFVASQLDSRDILNSANAAVAGASAQLELAASRIKKVIDTVNELALMVEGIKGIAERSNLHALNSSIQMSALSDGEIEEPSRFVDEMQGVSRKLATTAADAQRLVGMVQADAQAAGLSLSGCTSAIEDSASHASRVSTTLDRVGSHVDTLGSSHMLLTDELKKQQESLFQLADELCEIHGVDVQNDKLLVLMELAVDQQLMATKLEQSLSRYHVSRDKTIAG